MRSLADRWDEDVRYYSQSHFIALVSLGLAVWGFAVGRIGVPIGLLLVVALDIGCTVRRLRRDYG